MAKEKVKEIKHQNKSYIYYSMNGKVLRLSTGINWDDRLKNQKVITSTKKKVSDLVDKYIIENGYKPSVDYIRNKIKEKEVSKGKFFLDNFDDFFQKKKSRIRPSSLKDYTSFKNSLFDYQKFFKMKISFDDITESFVGKYKDFLYSEERPDDAETNGGLNDPTVAKRITSLKAYIKFLEENEIFNFPVKVKAYKPPQGYKKRIVYVNTKEVGKLLGLDLSGNLEKVRDIFVFGCMTSLRYSDIISLTDIDIKKGGLIDKMSQKGTSGETYKVYMNEVALKIWDKYNHNLNHFSNQIFNRLIKTICRDSKLFEDTIDDFKYVDGKRIVEKKPRWTLISSHTSRRSFISNSIIAGIPLNAIMEMSSHKKIATLEKYIAEFGQRDNKLPNLLIP